MEQSKRIEYLSTETGTIRVLVGYTSSEVWQLWRDEAIERARERRTNWDAMKLAEQELSAKRGKLASKR